MLYRVQTLQIMLRLFSRHVLCSYSLKAGQICQQINLDFITPSCVCVALGPKLSFWTRTSSCDLKRISGLGIAVQEHEGAIAACVSACAPSSTIHQLLSSQMKFLAGSD